MTVDGGAGSPAPQPARSGPDVPTGTGVESRRGAPSRAGRQGGGVVGRHPWRTVAVGVIVVGLAVIVGGFLWVRTEANPSGPLGRQVVVAVAPGESESSVIGRLAADGVVGSSLAYRIWSQFNSLPGVGPGPTPSTRTRASPGCEACCPPAPTSSRSPSRPASPCARWPNGWASCRGTRPKPSRRWPRPGRCTRRGSRSASNNLDGLLGTGTYLVVPGETDRQLLVGMVDRFDRWPTPRAWPPVPPALATPRTRSSPWPRSSRRRGSSRRTWARWPGSSTTGWPLASACRWTRPSSTPKDRDGGTVTSADLPPSRRTTPTSTPA